LRRWRVELGEADAVGLVGDEQVQDGPDEGQAAVFAGEPAHDLGAAFDLAERAFEQVGAARAPAVPGWAAQVHDEGVEVVGQTAGSRAQAARLELVDECPEALWSGPRFADM
jgi:hypothetical protein